MLSARAVFSRRIESWAHRRHGNQTSPQVLGASRIYILPSKSGVVFALMLFVMLVGSMNYNNSMGLTLTFLLSSFMLVAMHQCHRNLLGLTVRFDSPEAVFAGQSAKIPITLNNAQRHRRVDLRLSIAQRQHQAINLDVQQTLPTSFVHPTQQRGLHKLDRLRLGCRFPGGLFTAWTWIYWDTTILVYPEPNGDLPLPEATAGDEKGGHVVSRGDEELAELREYQLGDNLSKIAWKQAARSDDLLSKTFEDHANQELWLDWHSLASLNVEARLSQLSQWVLEAESANMRFGLRLPQKQIGLSCGKQHAAQCLTELALYS